MTRTGWTGEVGYEIYLRDGSKGDELWERIMEAGKPHHIRPTGPSDIRRIEAGILNWGADITLENNPYEVGLERLVDEEKRWLEKNIGYAMVPLAQAEPDTGLAIAIPELGERGATVVPKPFVDPRKLIPRT